MKINIKIASSFPILHFIRGAEEAGNRVRIFVKNFISLLLWFILPTPNALS
jgi:hypothetical protein